MLGHRCPAPRRPADGGRRHRAGHGEHRPDGPVPAGRNARHSNRAPATC